MFLLLLLLNCNYYYYISILFINIYIYFFIYLFIFFLLYFLFLFVIIIIIIIIMIFIIFLIIYLFIIYYFRWYSLNESAAYVDHEKQGDASGYLSSAVSLSGDTAVFDLRFLVNDGSENEQIYTNNEISWSTGSIMNTSSSNSWLDSGNINVASVFRLINTIDWNADGLLQYGGDLYNFYARDLSQDSSEVLFSTGGDGKYGGDYYNWYVCYCSVCL